MMWYSHSCWGAGACVLIDHVLGRKGIGPVAAAGVGWVSAWAPDVDHPKSLVGRRLPAAYHMLTPGHRGPTHSIAWCVAFFGPFMYFAPGMLAALINWAWSWHAGESLGLPTTLASPLFAFFCVIGALTHLVTDAMTVGGVPLLWPLSVEKFRILGPLSFRVGTWREHAVTASWVVLVCWWASSW